MKANSRLQRQKQINFAVGMASIDGGRPSSFTKKLLNEYENGSITSHELKKAIINKYTRINQ
ncbi:MAG TPA: hypothetical protein VK077_09735 [Virgibacillus sp.]|nr:hypothetical protein [Virgibacillus sp.]